MKLHLGILCWLFVFASSAKAQTPVGFNLAVSDSNFTTVPSAAYGAAGQQAGDWNHVTGSFPSFVSGPFVDVNGNTTGVTLQGTTGGYLVGLDIGNQSMTGDDEVLMRHSLYTGRALLYGAVRMEFHGLPAGSYRLFTYSVGSIATIVQVPGSVDGQQGTLFTSNAFGQGYVLGTTHLVHRINVQTGSPLVVEWGGGFSHDALVNGFQIVPDGTSQGVSYCPSMANSTGQMARMMFTGTPSVAANDLVLGVRDLPLNQIGYFVVSRDPGTGIFPPGSQGIFCIGNSIGRHNRPGEVLNSGSSGVVRMSLDLMDVPQPQGPVAVAPGETWHWQYWFRDLNPSSTSNFSDANSVTFTQ